MNLLIYLSDRYIISSHFVNSILAPTIHVCPRRSRKYQHFLNSDRPMKERSMSEQTEGKRVPGQTEPTRLIGNFIMQPLVHSYIVFIPSFVLRDGSFSLPGCLYLWLRVFSWIYSSSFLLRIIEEKIWLGHKQLLLLILCNMVHILVCLFSYLLENFPTEMCGSSRKT